MVLKLISAHSLRDTAAVASARAAELYGLEILMDGIQVRMKDLYNGIALLVVTRSNGTIQFMKHDLSCFLMSIYVLNLLLVFLAGLKEEFERILAHLVLPSFWKLKLVD